MPSQHIAARWDKMLWSMILLMLCKINELGQSPNIAEIAAETFVSNIGFASG